MDKLDKILKNVASLKPLQPVKNCYKKLFQNVKTYPVTIPFNNVYRFDFFPKCLG